MMGGMDVCYARPGGQGWATVTLMARLAAEVFEGRLSEHAATRDYGRLRRAGALLPRIRGRGRLLVIAATPGDLLAAVRLRHWLPGYSQVNAWVIDSFWDERIPRFARHRGHFDHLFITDAELVDTWAQATGSPTHWLPFGTDALAAPTPEGDRAVDLQRVGRQPPPWADDQATADAALLQGVRFEGSPPFHDDPGQNQAELLAAMGRARFTLSFSNAAAPAAYTHPTREYLTGRWTDALARGATVAGIAPNCRATDEQLWPEALLDLGSTDRDQGLGVIAAALPEWTPARARHNHAMALQRLDWRLRFDALADLVGFRSATLDQALGDLHARQRLVGGQ